MKEQQIFEFNSSQIRNFFSNLVKIKNLSICKPVIRNFLIRYQEFKDLRDLKLQKYKIPDNSLPNNLAQNLMKSIEPFNGQLILSDYLNTKKKSFQNDMKANGRFSSPQLIGNEVFKNIKLSTVKVKPRNLNRTSSNIEQARKENFQLMQDISKVVSRLVII